MLIEHAVAASERDEMFIISDAGGAQVGIGARGQPAIQSAGPGPQVSAPIVPPVTLDTVVKQRYQGVVDNPFGAKPPQEPGILSHDLMKG